MNSKTCQRLLAAFSVTFAVSGHAAPITHYSSVTTATAGSTSGWDYISNDPTYLQSNASTSGDPVSASRTYVGAEGASSAAAEATLSTGTLKAKADSSTTANPSSPFSNTTGFARADIGDSFRFGTSTGPFTWSSTTDATFSIDLSGFSSVMGASSNRANVGFFLTILQPGTLDGYAQWLINDAAYPSTSSADTIMSFSYHIAGTVYSFHDGSFSTGVNDITFAPGGDFDWIAGITVDTAAFDGPGSFYGTGPQTAMADYFSTAVMSFSGPTGATTYSASGLFPGTVALQNDNAVSAPPVLALLGLGLLGMGYSRRNS